MGRTKYIIFIVFLIFFTNANIYSREISSLSSVKGLYFVLAEESKYDNGFFVKIYLLNREEGDNRLQLAGDFITGMDLHINYYQEYNFLNMSDADDKLYIINFDKPWEIKELKGFDVGMTFPFERDGNIYLGRKLWDYLILLDINSLEKTADEIKEGSYAETILFEGIGYTGFKIRGDRKFMPYSYR
ncbi:MAG: hypothetical protein GX175_11380 [Halanaerobiaceae bacterium]|nr:hypothetical protein [Halanaerobiaceae bacterium]